MEGEKIHLNRQAINTVEKNKMSPWWESKVAGSKQNRSTFLTG